ncbi:MAG: hypothetical protein Q9227_009177 [Pyrenula ochraceoflavens]
MKALYLDAKIKETDWKPLYITTVIREPKDDTPIAFISCRVYRGKLGNIDGEFAKPPPTTKLPDIQDPDNREYWEWFWTEARNQTRDMEELHQPVIIVQALGTHPDWRRMGAATMLLEWICGVAAQSDLRLAVQPGEFAAQIGFYEKFGFKLCRELVIVDKDRFPEQEAISLPMMIKDLQQ